HRLATSERHARTLKAQLAKTEQQVEQFLDRIVEADTASIVTAYERRIRKLEEQKIVIKEKIANCGRPVRSFDETLRTALEFLGNPHRLWVSKHPADRQAVVKLTFLHRPAYVRNEGF